MTKNKLTYHKVSDIINMYSGVYENLTKKVMNMKKNLLLVAVFALLSLSLSAKETDKTEAVTESRNKVTSPWDGWHGTFGILQETENVEGSGDKDGLYEPSVYFDLRKGKWSFGMTNYNENHDFDYSDWTRGNYLNRLELRAHYQFTDNDKYAVGLGAALRNYQWFHKDGTSPTTTNNRWLNIQPDWRYNFTSNLSYEGWLGLYSMFNDAQENGYSDKELETESGLKYKFNDFISVRLNYYLDRGWNLGGPTENSFNNQQIRGYVPMNFAFFGEKTTTITPYFRQGFINKSWNAGANQANNEIDTRLGLRIDQQLPAGFAVSLEYAYEMRNQQDSAPGQKSFSKFHYTGVGLSYSF